MSLKDNLSQAIKEMLKKDGIVGDEMLSEQSEKTELDRYIEPEQPEIQAVSEKVFEEPAPIHTPTQEKDNSFYERIMRETQEAKQQRNSFAQQEQEIYAEPTKQNTASVQNAPYSQMPSDDGEERTVISRNTIIEGNIRSFASVTIDGSIKGDVQITKNAAISGKVIGNVECNNASMSGSQMQGNVSSKGQVRFDRDSLILGDIQAQYLDMNGKVKGNIDINGKAEFKSDAYIIGDINVSTLTVLEGATISGHVNTTFLQEAPTTIFPEIITMSEIG